MTLLGGNHSPGQGVSSTGGTLTGSQSPAVYISSYRVYRESIQCSHAQMVISGVLALSPTLWLLSQPSSCVRALFTLLILPAQLRWPVCPRLRRLKGLEFFTHCNHLHGRRASSHHAECSFYISFCAGGCRSMERPNMAVLMSRELRCLVTGREQEDRCGRGKGALCLCSCIPGA